VLLEVCNPCGLSGAVAVSLPLGLVDRVCGMGSGANATTLHGHALSDGDCTVTTTCDSYCLRLCGGYPMGPALAGDGGFIVERSGATGCLDRGTTDWWHRLVAALDTVQQTLEKGSPRFQCNK